MNRTSNLLAAGLLAAGAACAMTATAHAATCPTRESFFGTVQRIQSNHTIIVRAPNGHSGLIMIDSGTQAHTNGYPLRNGIYVGAYGCVTPNGVFHASELTYAKDAAFYNKTDSGVIQRVENGRLIVNEPQSHTTGIWYVPDTDEFRAGQPVSGTGMLAANGSFYPQTINGRNVAADLDTSNATQANAPQSNAITLAGRVQHIAPGRLIVWEPARHTSGTWIVSNTGAFRVGESVKATGTMRNGDFYPSDIPLH